MNYTAVSGKSNQEVSFFLTGVIFSLQSTGLPANLGTEVGLAITMHGITVYLVFPEVVLQCVNASLHTSKISANQRRVSLTSAAKKTRDWPRRRHREYISAVENLSPRQTPSGHGQDESLQEEESGDDERVERVRKREEGTTRQE